MPVVLLTAALFTSQTMVAAAQKGDKLPPPSEKRSALTAGEAAAKQLLVLMDTDKSGKVSKQEWMSFMEAEFDRLDKNKDGELDMKELEKSHVRSTTHFSAVGK
jgi:hypothetical protein